MKDTPHSYIGEETRRASQNFHITLKPVDARLIRAMAVVKIAAVQANAKEKRIHPDRSAAIIQAAKEIIEGKHPDQFITDSIQGGAGTSMHMNVNEVIANRATEILQGKTLVHYLDHVNLSQSTNDVVPTALRIVCLEEIDRYLQALELLQEAFQTKAKEFAQVVKVGRTHLQDAVPITLGQEFGAYAAFVKRDRQRLTELKKYLLPTNLGGTAIGTGINASAFYIKHANIFLKKLTGYTFFPADDLIDATQNIDVFPQVASALQLSAIGLSKICSDLRLLASGPLAGLGEIILPEYQKGSTIMPGKVNPVILEVISQISFQVAGNNTVSALVFYHGQLELNTMLPVLAKTLIESFDALTNGVKTLTQCIQHLQANEPRCNDLFKKSMVMATPLTRLIGYDKTAELVKGAIQHHQSLIEEARQTKQWTEAELKKLFVTHITY